MIEEKTFKVTTAGETGCMSRDAPLPRYPLWMPKNHSKRVSLPPSRSKIGQRWILPCERVEQNRGTLPRWAKFHDSKCEDSSVYSRCRALSSVCIAPPTPATSVSAEANASRRPART
eukprot:3643546-Rhodomonas_salina.1